MAEESYWTGLARKSISRRRIVASAGAGGMALAISAITGCGGRSGSSGSSSKQAAPSGVGKEPKRGGTIAHAGGKSGSYDTQGTTLDPHINTPLGARGFRLMYQGLLGYDLRNYTVQPELAQKWEQPSPTEFLFHLQPGVKWQNKPPLNGRELTAADVAFSLNRFRTNDPRFANRSLFANFDTIEAVDKSTVRITSKGPDATVLPYLSADTAMVVAPEIVQKFDKLTTADAVVGTGPFVMKSVEDNVGAEYVRNPDYWKPGRPYLDGVRTPYLVDEQAAYAAFQGGQVDIARLLGSETKGYIAKQGSGYTPAWFKDDTVIMTQPNTKVKPLNDARVTRALRLLIDHNETNSAWAEVWFGRGRYGSIFCTGLDDWDLTDDEYGKLLEWKQPKDDAVKEALSLLSAAGYTKDNPLAFELTGTNGSFNSAGNQTLQSQWTRLGQGVVKATLKEVDLATSNSVRANRTFTFYLGGNGASSPEPDAWLTSIYRSNGARNYTGFNDPAIDAMIDKQRTIFDLAERKAAVKEIVRTMIERGPTTIPANRYFFDAVKPKVHDYAPEFFMNGRQYEWIWLD